MTGLRRVFEEINRLRQEGTLLDYAVGGASAVPFHTEPVNTYDLDLFVFLPHTSGTIISMAPLYSRLEELGYHPHAEHVMIEGVPVQFLPAYNPLVEDAVRKAVTLDYLGVPVRVVSAEHLAALALQTGGARRISRVRLLRESPSFDEQTFLALLQHYGLTDRNRT